MESIQSLIIGFITGCFLYYLLFHNSITYHGEDSKKVCNKIYKIDGKCYKFYPKVCICTN